MTRVASPSNPAMVSFDPTPWIRPSLTVTAWAMVSIGSTVITLPLRRTKSAANSAGAGVTARFVNTSADDSGLKVAGTVEDG